jgi:hypothetical protein
MKKSLFFLFSLVLFLPTLIAKPKQPLDTQLVLTNTIVKDNNIEYTLVYQCRPWVTSTNISFKLELPAEFELEEGFSYWEGELKANNLFSREFKVKAPAKKSGKLQINAILKIESATSVKVSTITLSNKSIKKKTSPLPFTFGSGSAKNKGERKKIRRE